MRDQRRHGYRKNAASQDRDNRFVRACAVETHMDMSRQAFYAKKYKKHAGDQRVNLGLNSYGKDPSMWKHMFWGITKENRLHWTDFTLIELQLARTYKEKKTRTVQI